MGINDNEVSLDDRLGTMSQTGMDLPKPNPSDNHLDLAFRFSYEPCTVPMMSADQQWRPRPMKNYVTLQCSIPTLHDLSKELHYWFDRVRLHLLFSRNELKS